MRKIIIVYSLIFVLAVNLALAFSFADISGYSAFKSPKNECFRGCKDVVKAAEEICRADEKNGLANCGSDKACREGIRQAAKSCHKEAKSQYKSCKSCCQNTFKECQKKSKEALKACKEDDANDDNENDKDDNDKNEKECHKAAKDVLKNCQFNCNVVPSQCPPPGIIDENGNCVCPPDLPSGVPPNCQAS